MAPNDFDRFFRLGSRQLHEGKARQAAENLLLAHELNPEHDDAALNLGGAYILSSQFTRAIPVLEALSERVPENPMVWTNLGAAYLGNPVLAGDEQQSRAKAAFKKALELDPQAPSVAYNLGLIARDRNEISEAIYWFEKALEANPADRDARNILRRLRSKRDGRETA